MSGKTRNGLFPRVFPLIPCIGICYKPDDGKNVPFHFCFPFQGAMPSLLISRCKKRICYVGQDVCLTLLSGQGQLGSPVKFRVQA